MGEGEEALCVGAASVALLASVVNPLTFKKPQLLRFYLSPRRPEALSKCKSFPNRLRDTSKHVVQIGQIDVNV